MKKSEKKSIHQRSFLTLEDLKRISTFEFANEKLSRVRDCFVFACFTGLTYGDLKDLSRDKLVEHKGRLCIMGYRENTGKQYFIPLLNLALQILKKYENDPACISMGKLLPVGSNQSMNKYLKAIAATCGINKNLHLQAARYFAVTNLFIHAVSIEIISKIFGYKTISMTHRYAKLNNDTIIDAMDNIDDQMTKEFTNAVPIEF